MNAPSNRQLARLIGEIIVERQRLLIREANYLRALVGLPPVKAERAGQEPPRSTVPKRPHRLKCS